MARLAQQQLQAVLTRGEVVRGEFWIAGSNVESAGTLEWSPDGGATLRLIGDTKGWPTDLGRYDYVVHGVLDAQEPITLLNTGVRSIALMNRPTELSSYTLVWGANINPASKWSRVVYETASLAGWVADNGFEPRLSRRHRMDGIRLREPQHRPVNLPRAEAHLATEVDADPLGYRADWSVRARQRLVVDVRRPASIDDLHTRYAVPLVCFTSFVSDRPDCLRSEIVLDRDKNERAEIWRSGPRYEPEPWRPGKDYLIWATELPRLSTAFAKWWRRHSESPALGLFADHINLGRTYSQPRFLTLYSALEGYCRARTGRNQLRQLRSYAGVDTSAHGCTNEALKLIGVSRDYVAHFTIHEVPASRIIHSLVDTTRCAHALLQSCLLRDLGFGPRQTERLMHRYHRSWPLPRF
jgi:hypothetical protein